MVAYRFNTIGVSDGISMGTDGMSFSLQSRDLIADSVETVMGGQWYAPHQFSVQFNRNFFVSLCFVGARDIRKCNDLQPNSGRLRCLL